MPWGVIYGAIRHFYERAFWRWSTAITRYEAGYVLNYTGKRHLSGANQLWIDDPTCLDGRLLEQATRFFRPHWAEWSLLALPEAQPDIYARCQRLAMVELWSNPLMARVGVPNWTYNPRPFQIKRIYGEQNRQLAYRIASEAFRMEWNPRQEMYTAAHEADPHFIHYLVHYEGHPAAVGTVNYYNGVAGIWSIATRDLFRRRGIAKALVTHICAEAVAAGYPLVMLLSTSQGITVYQRLGFDMIGTGSYMSGVMY